MSETNTNDDTPRHPRGRKITKKPKENVIENHLIKRVKELGGLCWKFNSASLPGVPDRVVIISGITAFIEVKRPGERPKRHQRVAIATLRRHGVVADYVDTKKDVDAVLVKIMERVESVEPAVPVLPTEMLKPTND